MTNFGHITILNPRFCNPAAGHEKGGVEGLVGFARRNYMVPVPEAEDLAALNEKLLQECLAYGDHTISGRQQPVNDLFEAERSHLISLPEIPFSNIDTVHAKADKFATVVIDKNHYSVPTAYAHFKVTAVMHIDRVEIFYRNKRIACHQRLYGNNKWSLVTGSLPGAYPSGPRLLTRPGPFGNGGRAGRHVLKPC